MIHQINRVTEFMDSKKNFRSHLLLFILATPAIWLVWHLTDNTYQWHFWIIAAWTKGLQVHFLRAILLKSKTFEKLKLWLSSKIHSEAFRSLQVCRKAR